MGHKVLKEYYDIKYIVAIYNKEGLGPCVCIGSCYVHDLVAISIKDCKIKYSCIVKPGENSEIGQLAARIAEDAKTGVIRALLDEPDTFARSLPVFTTDKWAVKAAFCEEYGWPNTTHDGEIMYENTYFQTRAEAYAYLLRDTKAGLTHTNFGYIFKEGVTKIKRAFKFLFRECWFWVAARTVGRIITKRSYGYKRT